MTRITVKKMCWGYRRLRYDFFIGCNLQCVFCRRPRLSGCCQSHCERCTGRWEFTGQRTRTGRPGAAHSSPGSVGGVSGTAELLHFPTTETSNETYLNLMEQYHPAYKAHQHPPLDRRFAEKNRQKRYEWRAKPGSTGLLERTTRLLIIFLEKDRSPHPAGKPDPVGRRDLTDHMLPLLYSGIPDKRAREDGPQPLYSPWRFFFAPKSE